MATTLKGEDETHVHVDKDGEHIALPKAMHSEAFLNTVRALPPMDMAAKLEQVAADQAAARYVPQHTALPPPTPEPGTVSDATADIGPDGQMVVQPGATFSQGAPPPGAPPLAEPTPPSAPPGQAMVAAPPQPTQMAPQQPGMGPGNPLGGYGAGYAGLQRTQRTIEHDAADAIRGINAGQLTQAKGQQELAEAQSNQGLAEAALYKDQNAQLAQANAEAARKTAFDTNYLNQSVQKLDTLQQDVASTKINPNAFWDSKSTLGKVGVGISMMLSGLGSAIAGHPGENKALDIINKAIDDNVAEQRNALNDKRSLAHDQVNAVGMARQLFSDHRQQELAATIAIRNTVVDKIKETLASTASPVALANGKIAIGKLMSDNARDGHAFKTVTNNSATQIYGAMGNIEAEHAKTAAALEAARIKAGSPAKLDSRTKLVLGRHNAAYNQASQLLTDLLQYRKKHAAGGLVGEDLAIANQRTAQLRDQLVKLGYSEKRVDDIVPAAGNVFGHTGARLDALQGDLDRHHDAFTQGILQAGGGGETRPRRAATEKLKLPMAIFRQARESSPG